MTGADDTSAHYSQDGLSSGLSEGLGSNVPQILNLPSKLYLSGTFLGILHLLKFTFGSCFNPAY